MTKVLAVLSVTPDYEEFALPQLKSILRPMNIPLSELLKYQIQQLPAQEYQINYKCFKNYPFIILNIPDFQKHKPYLTKAASNGVMVSKFIQLISEANTFQQLFQNYDKDFVKKQFSDWNSSIFCQFYSRNRGIGRDEQRLKIHQILQKMQICGKVDLEKPSTILALVEDHTWFIKHHELPSKDTLKKIYFGLELSSNRPLKGTAKFNLKYQLSNRIYLGPTTTDNDLSFLMCHQAQIDQNSFVLDPFVGTGSLLVPPSHYGAYVFGSDLDIRVLNGYSVGQINKRSKYYQKQKQFQIYTPKIMLNFRQYGLKEPQIFRMDCLKGNFRKEGMFDAIICDPPYGLRAMSRKINNKVKDTKKDSEQNVSKQQVQQKVKQQEKIQNVEDAQQIPQQQSKLNQQECEDVEDEKEIQKRKERRQIRKQKRRQIKEDRTEEEKKYKQQIQDKFNDQINKKWTYKPNIQCSPKEQIYNGLLNFASRYLKLGGFLVFLYPILEEENFKGSGEKLPKHSQFKLLDFSVHKLKEGNVRVLITMKKVPETKNKEQ